MSDGTGRGEIPAVAAEQPFQQGAALRFRTRAEDVPDRPGDVPEMHQEQVRARGADLPRRDRQVIVLHPDKGTARRLLCRGRGEDPVGLDVALPVGPPEPRLVHGHVAERPERLVGKAVVGALDDVRRQPDAPQHIAGIFGRHPDVVTGVHGLAVGAAAAPRDPHAAHRLHHGVERRNESAGRTLHHGAPARALVHVRLPVAHDHVLAVGEAGDDGVDTLLASRDHRRVGTSCGRKQ